MVSMATFLIKRIQITSLLWVQVVIIQVNSKNELKWHETLCGRGAATEFTAFTDCGLNSPKFNGERWGEDKTKHVPALVMGLWASWQLMHVGRTCVYWCSPASVDRGHLSVTSTDSPRFWALKKVTWDAENVAFIFVTTTGLVAFDDLFLTSHTWYTDASAPTCFVKSFPFR